MILSETIHDVGQIASRAGFANHALAEVDGRVRATGWAREELDRPKKGQTNREVKRRAKNLFFRI